MPIDDREKTEQHIALYLPSFAGGGAQRVMITLANGLAARGHRVDLVAVQAQGPYLSEVSPNVQIVNLNKSRVIFSLLPLASYLRRQRPDAILSALYHANITAILAWSIARVKTRIIVSEHSAPSLSLAGNGKIALLRWLVCKLYPRANVVVCVSQQMQKDMESFLGISVDKLCTIYNPLNVESIHSLMNEPVNHPWLSTAANEPVVLAVGRLTAAKDYPTLLKAFALLRKRCPTKLIILGEGEEKARLANLVEQLDINDHVEILSFQSNPFAWMKACDVYVMSSQREGLPGALLEAMACGTRIVSTDCKTGPREILENGRWGRLVPVGDPEALAVSIEQSLSEEKLQLQERIKAFHMDNSIISYEEVTLGRYHV